MCANKNVDANIFLFLSQSRHTQPSFNFLILSWWKKLFCSLARSLV